MGNVVTAELLSDARNYLDITWQDDETDKKLTGILARGMAFLDRAAGAQLDYSAEDFPRGLLFDYARYARENALGDFTEHYLTELNSLRVYTEGEAAAKDGVIDETQA